MNVLSLFDGMSCGQLALNRVGISVDKYYASEIDKYAIKVTQHNFPNTIQLGDITTWRTWDIDWSSIDLVTGGFPCQAWSVSGLQLGDKDERGMLFWVMLDIMKHIKSNNPDVKFLIENVKMKKDFEEYITRHTVGALGDLNKILINSSLVSAQHRERYYWTNINITNQPEDKKLTLESVLENGYTDREKSYCIVANYFKGGGIRDYFEKHRRQIVFLEKELPEDIMTLKWRNLTPTECEKLQTVPVGYTSVVSNTQRYKMLGNGWTVDVVAHILKGLHEKDN